MINNNVFTVHFSNIISYVLQNHSNVGVCVCVWDGGVGCCVRSKKDDKIFHLSQCLSLIFANFSPNRGKGR